MTLQSRGIDLMGKVIKWKSICFLNPLDTSSIYATKVFNFGRGFDFAVILYMMAILELWSRRTHIGVVAAIVIANVFSLNVSTVVGFPL